MASTEYNISADTFSDEASESFEHTCLGPIGQQVSAFLFEVAAVDQLYDHTIVL